MAIYRNLERVFSIVDFSATHDQLLLRSMRSGEFENNIDILIKGVSRIILPTLLEGLEISILNDDNKIKFLQENYSFNIDNDNRIFLIRDGTNNKYFINAYCFGVFHNKLDILETSIGRYDYESLGEMQLWYAE